MKLQRLRELALGATQKEWSIIDGYYPGFIEIFGISFKVSIVTAASDLSGVHSLQREHDAAYIAAACPANILPILESYEELLAASKGYLDNSVSDIGRQGRQAHGALLQAITNAEKLSQ